MKRLSYNVVLELGLEFHMNNPQKVYGISTPGFQSHNIQVHAWEVGKYKSDILYIFGYLCLTAITAILQSTVVYKNNCTKLKLERRFKQQVFFLG